MEDNQLYALIWKLAFASLCVLIVSGASCSSFETYRITEAKDPIAVKCALASRESPQACMVVMTRDRTR